MKLKTHKNYFNPVVALLLMAVMANLTTGQRIKSFYPSIEASVPAVVVSGNPSCATLNGDNTNFPTVTSNFGFKIEPPESGTYNLNNTDGELTGGAPEDSANSITVNINGRIFNWSATLGIDAVIVKGGPNANAYVYNPEALSDTDLTTVDTTVPPDGTGDFGISHLEFCYDYQASLKIIKDTVPDNPQHFLFTASGAGAAANGIASFTLDDDGGSDNTFSNMISFEITSTGAGNPITITEEMVALWRIRPGDGIVCTQSGPGSVANNTIDIDNRNVTVIVEPNESVTCTFTNEFTLLTSAGATMSGRIINTSGRGLKGITISAMALSSGEISYSSVDSNGHFRFEDMPVGESYLVEVKSRYFSFEPASKIVTLNGDYADVVFTTVSPKKTR